MISPVFIKIFWPPETKALRLSSLTIYILTLVSSKFAALNNGRDKKLMPCSISVSRISDNFLL